MKRPIAATMRFLSILLLLFLILPARAGAENDAGGVFGDNLTWNLDGGTLTISGSGSMGNMTAAPWEALKDTIVRVDIRPGVTAVASAAFSQCANLTGVSIPDTVETIGEYAFSSCDSLSEVTIPDSVTRIKYAAFSWCGALKTVTLSRNITEIDSYTFQECVSLRDITIPEGVTNIALWSFFNCSSLSRITLPGSLKRIGYFAFYGCTGLRSVSYGASASDWGEIDIGSDNGCLTGAQISWGGGEPEKAELQMADTDFGTAESGYRFRVRLTGTLRGFAAAALYTRDNRMTGCVFAPASQTPVLSFDRGTAGAYAKLTWLDDDLRPLCGAVRVELDGGQIPGPVTLEDLLDSSHSEVFADGDVVYQPQAEHLAYDEDEPVLYYDNLLTVFLMREFSPEELRVLLDAVDGTLVTYLSGAVNLLQITVPASDLPRLKDLAARIAAMDDVLDADYEIPMEIGPDAGADRNPWPLGGYEEEERGNEDEPGGQDWWAEAVRAYTAWSYDDLSGGVTVGILDDGFDTGHEDLSGQLTPLYPGMPHTEAEHGTMVAGIIAAKNNESGIRGVADRAELVYADTTPYRNDTFEVINRGTYINYLSDLISQRGASVVNLSWGVTRDAEDRYLQENPGKNHLNYLMQVLGWNRAAEKHARLCLNLIVSLMRSGQDFLIVQSAGNGLKHAGGFSTGIEADKNGYFCGITERLYQDFLNGLNEKTRNRLLRDGITFQSVADHILVAGAADDRGRMTEMSNYGSQVHLTAPGLNVLTTRFGNEYVQESGTSLAAPMVSGAAALLKSMDPSLSMPEVRSILLRTARQNAVEGVGDGAGRVYPLLDAGAAVESIACHTKIRVQDAEGVLLTGASVQVTDKTGTVRSAVYDEQTGFYTVSTFRGTGSYTISLDGYQSDSGSVQLDGTALARTLTANPKPGDAAAFNGHIYKMYNPMTWDEAEAYCEAQGGHLVTITSREEQEFITSYVSYLNGAYVWIGMRRPWEQWVTGEAVSYTNWGYGEPDGWSGQYYGCLLSGGTLRGGSYRIGAGEWDDWQGPSTYFLCEWDSSELFENARRCGDQAFWKLENGVLTISGTGPMWNFHSAATMSTYHMDDAQCGGAAPWYALRDQIREVVVNAGITELGNGAFLQCTNLTKAALPEGLIHTGICTFRGCTSLTEMELPESLQTIDTSCFQGCSGLRTVTVPGTGFWGVGHYAFFRCPALRSVYLPGSVTFIGLYSFEEGSDSLHIHFAGSASQWNGIQFDSHNEALNRAVIEYQ